MTEQTLAALLGALGTALVTAVGGLAWIVRRQQHQNGNSNGVLTTLQHLNITLGKQTDVLQELVTTSKVHNAEATLRHDALVEVLRHLRGN